PAMGGPAERRYEDGFFPTPDGRARFFARAYQGDEELPSREFPLLLTSGRVAGQWHTRTKTGLVPALNKLDPSPYLEMHPEDARTLALRAGQKLTITSRRGSS